MSDVTWPETGTDRQQLATGGVRLLPPATTTALLGATPESWSRFHRHWEALRVDRTTPGRHSRRLRRYGHYQVSVTGRFRLLAHDPFDLPHTGNPFAEPPYDALTDDFASDPLLEAVLRLLVEYAADLDDAVLWDAEVHPLRELAAAESGGHAPARAHRDATLIAHLLLGRENAAGGETVVCSPTGRRLFAVTLDEPGTLLLTDGRGTELTGTLFHPADPARPARRDLLVVTFAPA